MSDDVILNVSDLTISLPGRSGGFGAHGVSFEVRRGRTMCLVGESGSGKSLTAQSILGLLPATFAPPTGRIAFEGRDLLSLPKAEVRRVRGAGIGMVFQEPMSALNPLMRVGAQIAEVIRQHRGGDHTQMRGRVAEMLEAVALDPDLFMRRYPHQLSGGQRQRVMIAMALVLSPQLLIADEPTTALDVTTQAQILEIIADLQRRHGTGVLFITHDFGVVADIADDVTVLKDACVVEQGQAAEVLTAPQHAYTRRLLDAVPKGRIVAERRIAEAAPSIVVEGLCKTYDQGTWPFRSRSVAAMQDLSFSLAPGEILGIVGESGSGKSTAARCIARLTEPDSGTITLGGRDFTALRDEDLRTARRDLQVVFQDPYSSLNPRRRVGDIIVQAQRNFGVPAEEARRKAREILDLVGLPPDCAERFPGTFSGGQRQRICIARSLVLDPTVLIADEAVSALDVSVQAQILDFLRDIRDRFDLSVIFITHDLRVAAELCDRIVVMKAGAVVETGSAGEVLGAPREEYTRALIASIPGKSLLADHSRIAIRGRQRHHFPSQMKEPR